METILIPIDVLIEKFKPLISGIGLYIFLLIASSFLGFLKYKSAMFVVGKILSFSKVVLYGAFVWLALYLHYDPETKHFTLHLINELSLDRTFVILLAGTEAISNLHAFFDFE